VDINLLVVIKLIGETYYHKLYKSDIDPEDFAWVTK